MTIPDAIPLKTILKIVSRLLLTAATLWFSITAYGYDHASSIESNPFSVNAGDLNQRHAAILHDLISKPARIIDRHALKLDMSEFKSSDFTQIILQSREHATLGFIGSNYQRLSIRINSVRPHPTKLNTYIVKGESQVKTHKLTFDGELALQSLYGYGSLDYGVDDEYKDQELQHQGFAVFDYRLDEDPNQRYSGSFIGKMYMKWYRTTDGELHYDNINNYADGNYNNLYYGVWKEYHSNTVKVAAWSDDTIPRLIAPDLNIGAGEFQPDYKYLDYGWDAYRLSR